MFGSKMNFWGKTPSASFFSKFNTVSDYYWAIMKIWAKTLIECKYNPLDIRRKVNEHKTFRRRPGRQLKRKKTDTLKVPEFKYEFKSVNWIKVNFCGKLDSQIWWKLILVGINTRGFWSNTSRLLNLLISRHAAFSVWAGIPAKVNFEAK